MEEWTKRSSFVDVRCAHLADCINDNIACEKSDDSFHFTVDQSVFQLAT